MISDWWNRGRCWWLNRGRRRVLARLDGDRELLSEYSILRFAYGHWDRRDLPSFGGAEQVVPWFTYPALEYLRQLDLAQKAVFEWGCGGSTLYFARWARLVCSVEHDAAWHARIQGLKADHVTLRLVGEQDYAKAISSFGQMFDIIVIDGILRAACAVEACRFLNDTGMIILDNSDWYREAARILRDQGLIEVDMHGFGPLNPYTWTTSLFLRRRFDFTPRDGVQPRPPLGGIEQTLD